MPYDFDLPSATGALANGAGVQPWSSPEQYVIFSIDFVPGYSSTGARALRVAGFESDLRGLDIGFKRLVGCYKGEQEPAWIINARDWRKLAASGWIDGQESVLHLGPWQDGGRAATLHYQHLEAPGVNKWQESIGTFQLTSKKRALASDAWTFDPSTGEYFIAE